MGPQKPWISVAWRTLLGFPLAAVLSALGMALASALAVFFGVAALPNILLMLMVGAGVGAGIGAGIILLRVDSIPAWPILLGAGLALSAASFGGAWVGFKSAATFPPSRTPDAWGFAPTCSSREPILPWERRWCRTSWRCSSTSVMKACSAGSLAPRVSREATGRWDLPTGTAPARTAPGPLAVLPEPIRRRSHLSPATSGKSPSKTTRHPQRTGKQFLR